MVFAGKSIYRQLLQSANKMATDILVDRLAVSKAHSFLSKAVAANKKSKFTYRVTEESVDTVPLVVELVLRRVQHCPTIANATHQANSCSIVGRPELLLGCGWRNGGTLVCAKHCPMPGVAMAIAVAFGRVASM
jgi:DNA-binding HxlR family transcriptional regulator